MGNNLNEFVLDNADHAGEKFVDNSVDTDDVNVYFRNIRAALIAQIDRAEVVVGCVAWLTDKDILAALNKKKLVSIVVQKEDFLRPDLEASGNRWKAELRKMYDSMPKHAVRYQFNNILGSISTQGDPSLDPIRCVGNRNDAKAPSSPRMHNKFAVFASLDKDERVVPYAVWTGSFNFSKNAGMSLENAVLIKDMTIVDAYYQEFGQICAMSEPLDWTSDWIAPEWRIGS